jgi:hypothetical protein
VLNIEALSMSDKLPTQSHNLLLLVLTLAADTSSPLKMMEGEIISLEVPLHEVRAALPLA